MIRYLTRFLLIASAFYFVFPMIPGVHFHGSFIHALVVGVLFSILGFFVEAIATAIGALLTIGTLGVALLVIIPAWLLGFWLLPAFVLMTLSKFMPDTLSFTGWEAAIWSGLVMLVVGLITSPRKKKSKD